MGWVLVWVGFDMGRVLYGLGLMWVGFGVGWVWYVLGLLLVGFGMGLVWFGFDIGWVGLGLVFVLVWFCFSRNLGSRNLYPIDLHGYQAIKLPHL